MSGEAARGLIVAGASSHCGKTLVTSGLIGSLRKSGLTIAAAKCGPDYIDPKFLEAASGRPAINLDPWAMGAERLESLACTYAAGADLLVVEGVMGLYDGSRDGGGSTASLARVLNLPVIVIVDGQGTAQTAAAVAAGLASQATGFNVASAIVNRCASDRHRALIEEGFERAGIPLLGTVRRSQTIQVPSRHLGLVQASEQGGLDGLMTDAARLIGNSVDIAAVCQAASPISQRDLYSVRLANAINAHGLPPPGQHIAVANDVAFAFAYPHILQGWRDAGATLSTFSPLADEPPDPTADFIFLPGGYPELHAGSIAAASAFRSGMQAAQDRGALVYGECGGFMVLGDGLQDADGRDHAMLGLLPLSTTFSDRQMHLGYRRLDPLPGCAWTSPLRAHEFHYSRILDEGPADRLFATSTAEGDPLGEIGLRRGRVMGSFAHVIDAF